MADLGHVHQGSKQRFIDGCHYVVIEATCKACGSTFERETERNFDLNPLQIAFARQDCAICRRLLKGREPDCWASLSPSPRSGEDSRGEPSSG